MLRQTTREYFTIEGEHVFCGSGGEEGGKCVAILVNTRWASKICMFARVSERLAYLDIKLVGAIFRIFSTCFPHYGYLDSHVQGLYTSMSANMSGASRGKRQNIICGDFNAETGSWTEYDIPRTVGVNGLNESNPRGQ